MKKYFFSIILFLIAINYSYALQRATNVESLTFENNKCIIKGNGYMFYRTFTLDKDNSKVVAIDILGIKSYNPDIPSFILAKDSDAVNLIKLALHKDRNIGLRVVFNIKKSAQYQIDRNNNTITVVFNKYSAQQANKENPKPQPLTQEPAQASLNASKDNTVITSNETVSNKNTIESITAGALKDKTQLSITTTKKPVYEVKNENGNILISIKNVGPSKPVISNTSKLVENITTSIEKNDYNIKILTNNAHIDAISSTDKSIFVVLSPSQSVENLNIVSKEENTRFVGKKISFDVRDADLQDVLRVIAATANLDVMIGGSVKGKITMRLMNIPWDEALDLIAKQQGLVVQRQGNVLLINSASEATKLTKEQLEALAVQQNLERKNDAIAKIIKLNYIDPDYAKNIIDSLVYNKQKESIGFVVADKVNNSIICYDTKQNIQKIENIVKAIDMKKREIEISAKIVIVSKKYERDLGIQWGGNYAQKAFGQNSYMAIGGATLPLSVNAPSTASSGGINTGGFSVNNAFANSNYVVNTPAPTANPSGNFSLMVGNVMANYNLDLKLSLAEMNSYSKTLSSPKIITLDNQEATVESGQEIPYTTITTTGTQSTSFKDAVLSLKVTPHITNNGDIIMKLDIKDDSQGGTAPNGEIIIMKNTVTSTVIVKNGQTIAIGGVYVTATSKSENGVPFLKSIPILGWLFKSQQITKPENELYIFITPKIL
ncbi:Type 4 pilus biogenesis protein PilQ [Desulfurella amilsii]|uniref:Type 4 pilus biogenesis protein PilQ n=1 Tax=Desulfurella amilsii TaxID=1562698 RepID=A0A1X4XW04_9BACT|nr:type IV pilus secretin PilQ [Desulfurella amilsii]OSS41704.1 Type 4 pilus biogenesis protein PilQ [Desulfurella amilsii]